MVLGMDWLPIAKFKSDEGLRQAASGEVNKPLRAVEHEEDKEKLSGVKVKILVSS